MNKVFFLLLGIFLLNNVLAISGVSPGSYEVDFEPNLEKDFIFNFIIEGNRKVDVYAEGNLAENVELSEDKIFGVKTVLVTLKLPAKIETPGINEIKIIAAEVVGIIKVKVPYPDEFIELDLKAPNVNVEEFVDIELNVLNRGKAVEVIPRFEIYKVENKIGELIEIIDFEKTYVLQNQIFNSKLDTRDYTSGEYYIVAVVDYGENFADAKNSFKLGEKRVGVVNYTNGLRENKASKFDIEVESFWNSKIKDLYAEIKVVGSNYSFVTPSIRLEPWGKKILSGFFDTREVFGYDKELEIILHYDEKVSTELVSFQIAERFDFVLLIVILISLTVVIILVRRSKIFLEHVEEIKKERALKKSEDNNKNKIAK